MAEKPVLAFFGVTGGVLNQSLALALQAGNKCIVLVRSSTKLTELLKTKHNIIASAFPTQLIIVEGHARSDSAIEEVLSHKPDIIISGLGSTPKMQFDPLRPITMEDPTLIGDSATVLLGVLRRLTASGGLKPPLYVPISTVGINVRRDIPLPLLLYYKWVLPIPLRDARVLEEAVVKASLEDNPPISGYVIIRPVLMADAPMKEKYEARVGWTSHDLHYQRAKETVPAPETQPLKGYFVNRADIARWIQDEIVAGDREGWKNLCVTLTS